MLHQFRDSPFCEKVRRVLHFKRRHFEVREVPPTDALSRLRRLNPVGKVPVLEHAGEVICDSSRIARHIDDAFPEPPLFPVDSRDRALVELIEDWADESLYFFEVFFRFGLKDNAEESSRRASQSEPPLLRRATEAAMPTFMRSVLRAQGLGRKAPEQVLEEFDHRLGSLTHWLGPNDWLVGRSLTLADIAVYAQLAGVADTGEGAAVLGDRPTLLDWMARVNGATAPS